MKTWATRVPNPQNVMEGSFPNQQSSREGRRPRNPCHASKDIEWRRRAFKTSMPFGNPFPASSWRTRVNPCLPTPHLSGACAHPSLCHCGRACHTPCTRTASPAKDRMQGQCLLDWPVSPHWPRQHSALTTHTEPLNARLHLPPHRLSALSEVGMSCSLAMVLRLLDRPQQHTTVLADQGKGHACCSADQDLEMTPQ